MTKNVLCFGELLMRLVIDSDGEWLSKNEMNIYVGGAEYNVASALALWGIPVSYCSVLPENYLTEQLLSMMKSKNIDTSTILQKGNRIGLYYLPSGTDVKNAGVIYDRENSSFSSLKKGEIDWKKVFEGKNWFHFSAIVPALNPVLAEVCEEALKAASKLNIPISVDLNYRSKLWQYGKQPNEIMPNLVQYCDMIMGNIWSEEKMLDAPLNEVSTGKNVKKTYLKQAETTSNFIFDKYPKCKIVGNTFRFDNPDFFYYATLHNRKNIFVSSEYDTKNATEKVGSGDCFMAGLIYGLLNTFDEQSALDFATAAAFSKQFVKGDTTDKTVEDILKEIGATIEKQ